MSTSNAQRFLKTGSDDSALALKMYWGEVLTAFKAKTLLWNAVGEEGEGEAGPMAVASKMVGSGKSWQFPIYGADAEAEYHTPGVELLGQQFEVDEGTITIDDILVAHKDIPLDQTSMSHFEVMRPVARSNGRSLATKFDKQLFIVGCKSALTAAVTKNGMTIHNGGNIVTRATTTLALAYPLTSAGAQNFLDDVGTLARIMDEDSVPEDNRFLYISPYIRQVLGYAPSTLFSQDFDPGPNMKNRRVIGVVEGFNVVTPTLHLPSGNISHPKYSKYSINATHDNDGIPAALALCGADEGQAGIGYVSSSGVYPHMHFDERRNTTFTKAQMICGAGVLAPYCAGVIRVKSN